MSHPAHEQLWSFARHELPAEVSAQLTAHLGGCAACQTALADVRFAQETLADLPEPPPLPPALAARVGDSLVDTVLARAVRSPLRRFLEQLLQPPVLFAAAAALILAGVAVLWARRPPAPVVPDLVAVPTPTPAPTPHLVPPAPTPAPAPGPRLLASVTGAKKARIATQAAAKAQPVEAGTTLTTEPGGSLWLRLPDGSKAGLTAASSVTLTTLEDRRVDFEVGKGSLALEVPHRADRLLRVHAGELEVEDLGTRFVVSRSESRTLVAVQEGAVEVRTPTASQTVKAGHAVAWHDGRLDTLSFEAPKPAALPAPAAPTPAKLRDEQPTEAPPVDDGDDDEPSTPVQQQPPPAPVGDPAEWALPPEVGAPPPPARTPPPTPAPGPTRRPPFSLRVLERSLEELAAAFTAGSQREHQVRLVTRAADGGDCATTLRLADAWLAEPPTALFEEHRWRRAVLTQKQRCLFKLGRFPEAAEVKRELDGP